MSLRRQELKCDSVQNENVRVFLPLLRVVVIVILRETVAIHWNVSQAVPR